MKLLQSTSIFYSIIEISISFSIYRGKKCILLFFSLYLEITILEEYIKAYCTSIIEVFHMYTEYYLRK